MCKILVIAGIAADKQRAADKFLIGALPEMTSADKDGVGYVASAIEDGELFGERWLKPGSAFKRRTALSEKDQEISQKLGLAVDIEESYNSFGRIGQPYSAVMLHTRFATCGVSLNNVHPFVRDDTALIHNGIISNANRFKTPLSTCDSEAILTSYLDQGVDQTISSIEDTAGELEGYYACGVMARNREHQRIVDIFRSAGASLYVAWVKSLGTLAYATKAEILKDAAKRARTTISTPHEINPGWAIRLDALTGDVLTQARFTAKEKTRSIVRGTYGTEYHGSSAWSHLWDKDDKETEKEFKSKSEEADEICSACGEECLSNGLCSDPKCPFSDSLESVGT
jgi:hypothetical protein